MACPVFANYHLDIGREVVIHTCSNCASRSKVLDDSLGGQLVIVRAVDYQGFIVYERFRIARIFDGIASIGKNLSCLRTVTIGACAICLLYTSDAADE